MLRYAFALFLSIVALAATPLSAKSDETAKTRLVSCGEASCLLITGRRDHVGQTISINGRQMSVNGDKSWMIVLPIEAVRALCSESANTLHVTVVDGASGLTNTGTARLPIGLLGDSSRLGSIEVTAS